MIAIFSVNGVSAINYENNPNFTGNNINTYLYESIDFSNTINTTIEEEEL